MTHPSEGPPLPTVSTNNPQINPNVAQANGEEATNPLTPDNTGTSTANELRTDSHENWHDFKSRSGGIVSLSSCALAFQSKDNIHLSPASLFTK